MRTALKNTVALTALAASLGFAVPAAAQQPPAPAAGPRTLKMQSSWPAGLTLQDNFRFFAEQVDDSANRLEEDPLMAEGEDPGDAQQDGSSA